MTLIEGAKEISAPLEVGPPLYSICTLVTRPDEYLEMRASFISLGFGEADTEYLYIDNSENNKHDAFSAYNLFLQQAQSPYIILCHQDILLIEDGREKLDYLVREVTSCDPDWAILGNAGAASDGSVAVRISDPNGGNNQRRGAPFPTRVVSLDENFLLVRKQANLALSHDLSGFHLYGAELCVVAALLGFHAYVIDFHLLHKSGGNIDNVYHACHQAFAQKYRNKYRSRWLPLVTMKAIFLAGNRYEEFFARVLRKLSQYTPFQTLKQ